MGPPPPRALSASPGGGSDCGRELLRQRRAGGVVPMPWQEERDRDTERGRSLPLELLCPVNSVSVLFPLWQSLAGGAGHLGSLCPSCWRQRELARIRGHSGWGGRVSTTSQGWQLTPRPVGGAWCRAGRSQGPGDSGVWPLVEHMPHGHHGAEAAQEPRPQRGKPRLSHWPAGERWGCAWDPLPDRASPGS